MARRSLFSTFARAHRRNVQALSKATMSAATGAAAKVSKSVVKAAAETLRPPAGRGSWTAGIATGPAGPRRYHVFRPDVLTPVLGRPAPLMVMLHGCNQDGRGFAAATRMNQVAAREGFVVLYPTQDRIAHPNGCWRWYDVKSGRAAAEAATIVAMIDRACLLYGADPTRVAIAGLSAGACMAAYLATLHPLRIKAVVMHSGAAPGAASTSSDVGRALLGLSPPKAPAVTGSILPPLMVIHGGCDRVVAGRAGTMAAATWAASAGARPVAARQVRQGARYSMTVTDFKRAGRAVVTLNEIPDLGHAWSGGAAKLPFSDPDGPDSSRMAWAFAAKQFRSG